MNQNKWMSLVSEAMRSRGLTETYQEVREEYESIIGTSGGTGYGRYEEYFYPCDLPWDLSRTVSVKCLRSERIGPPPPSIKYYKEPVHLLGKIFRHEYKRHARDVTDIHNEVFELVKDLNSQDLFSNLSAAIPLRGDCEGSMMRSVIEMYLVLATATGPSAAKTKFMIRFGERLHQSNAKISWIEIENILKGFVTSGKRL